jgi:hypothetical protein
MSRPMETKLSKAFQMTTILPSKLGLLVSLKCYQMIPPQYDVIPEKQEYKSNLKQYFINIRLETFTANKCYKIFLDNQRVNIR